jgi:Protein of unknown function (DUF3419)
MTHATTPWRASRLSVRPAAARLAFGRMHEDAAIELAHLHGRIVCVASAGDTALALASDAANDVTAIDVNPAQVRYLEERLAGGPVRRGAVDRAMAVGRRLSGWDPVTAERFADLDDVTAQAAAWREHFDTPRFRLAVACIVGPLGLLVGSRRRIDAALRRRLSRGWATQPNRQNPYARLLLLGPRQAAAETARPAAPLHVHVADAAGYLEALEPGSVDGFALSNIVDAAGAAYTDRLVRAVRRAAAPGATAVLRSFGEPRTTEEDGWARRDRSHIWGRIHVGPADALGAWQR